MNVKYLVGLSAAVAMLIAAFSFRVMDPGKRLVPERLEIGRDSVGPKSEFESGLAKLSLSVPASPSVAPGPAPVAQSAILRAPVTPLSQSLEALSDAAEAAAPGFRRTKVRQEVQFHSGCVSRMESIL